MIVEKTPAKRRKPKPDERRAVVTTMIAQGATQAEVAAHLGVHRDTVAKDLAKLKPDVEIVRTILDRAQSRLREILPVESRVDKLKDTLDLAEATRQPLGMLAVLTRMDNIDGLRTEADLAKDRAEGSSITPMFMLPAGTQVQVSVSMHTMGGGTDEVRDAGKVIDVTPTDSIT